MEKISSSYKDATWEIRKPHAGLDSKLEQSFYPRGAVKNVSFASIAACKWWTSRRLTQELHSPYLVLLDMECL